MTIKEAGKRPYEEVTVSEDKGVDVIAYFSKDVSFVVCVIKGDYAVSCDGLCHDGNVKVLSREVVKKDAKVTVISSFIVDNINDGRYVIPLKGT